MTLYSISMNRAAVITGVTGQDGSYLAELLLSKDYDVYGIARRTSRSNTERIVGILDHPRFFLKEADLTDVNSLRSVFEEVSHYKRIEVYNLGAQSHVHTSFRQPELTADVDALGPLRILEILRSMNLTNARFYQASTSELYGKVMETPQSETTPFYPRSPYGVAKLYAFWIVKNYRESYGMFACNGILFNHESERRGEEFITRKITKGITRLKKDPEFVLELGNLDAKRDWGYAPDYVEGMWRMLQEEKPDDYVLATGETHTVREFLETAWGPIIWKGQGVNERGEDINGRVIVKVNPEFYRPAEVELLIGNPTKAWTQLGWKATTTFSELVTRMVKHDAK
jgi:GDPmannose 4,6-dehydratase